MAGALFEPIPLTYRGLFADNHFVEAQQLGISLQAASRIANSILHFYLFEEITKDRNIQIVRFYVGVPKPGSQVQELFAVMASGNLPIMAPIIKQTGKFFVEKMMEIIIKLGTGKKSEAAMAIEAVRDMAMRHAEFSSEVHRGQMQDKAWLQDHAVRLLEMNRSSLKALPEPVGRSVRELQVGEAGITIDEPDADILRSLQTLKLGEAGDFTVSFDGVFKSSGLGRVLLDSGRIVAAKITDPAVLLPGNVYTEALNTGASLRVRAKPTLKDGEIVKLFISEAQRAP